jgi:exopolysaccharide production protein ExoQ
MSQTPSRAPEAGSDGPTPWLAFLLVWGCFYLADPLTLTFSNHELVKVDAEEEGGNLERVERNIEQVESGSLYRQIGMVGLALFGLWQLSRPGRRLCIHGQLGEVILLFLGWCGLTILWSDVPLVTVRKVGVLGCLAVGALGMARACSLRQLIRFALFGASLVLLLGVPCEIVLGNFRPLHPDYRFSGLTWPAFSAWTLSILVLAVIALRPFTPWRGLLDLLACVAFCLCLLTRTRASVAGLVAALIFHAAATWPARRWIPALLLTALAAALLGLAAESMGIDVGAAAVNLVNLGRTESAADISGRAGLWNDLAPYLANRPLTGYGYDSFWTPARLMVVGQNNWGAPDAHNSYLNLALGAGVIATGLLVCILVLAFHRAWFAFRKSAKPEHLFIREVLIVQVINAAFVSSVLAPAVYSFVAMLLLAHLGFVEESLPSNPNQSSGAIA